MNKLLLILFAMLPFTLSAQFTVKAYRTTDDYKRKVVRIEITNTSDSDLVIRNQTSVSDGSMLYFSPTKKMEDRGAFFSFLPDPFEKDFSKRRLIVIKKGEMKKADYPFNYIREYIPIDKKIYLLGHIEYYLNWNELKSKHIEIEVE